LERGALRKVIDNALYHRNASTDLKVATALLQKLLEPDAQKRLAHFKWAPSFMKGVLEEPFFKGEILEAATLKTIVDNQEELKRGQEKQMALLLVIKELSFENKIELLHTRKALMKGIFEATEVKTPTTFIILDEMLSAEEPELSKGELEQLFSLKPRRMAAASSLPATSRWPKSGSIKPRSGSSVSRPLVRATGLRRQQPHKGLWKDQGGLR
jgi:hypothetical protein